MSSLNPSLSSHVASPVPVCSCLSQSSVFSDTKGDSPPNIANSKASLADSPCGGSPFYLAYTGRYPTPHKTSLLVGVALSSIFTVIEFRWLAHDYAVLAKLKRAYIAKAVIGLTLVILAIVFGITLYLAPNVGGMIEWTIAFGFTFYLLTFAYDLRMAKVTGRARRTRRWLRYPMD